MLKLRTKSTIKRLLSLRTFITFHHGREINMYLNFDRTKSEIENYTRLRVEVKEKQAEAVIRNFNIRYMIKQNRIVENF